MRRVVVTGLGMVTPLGCGVDTTWTRILSGQSGARKIDTFEVADLASRIACVIPRGDGSDATRDQTSIRASLDRRRQMRHRHPDRFGNRRPVRHRRHGVAAEGTRAAQGIAVLHPRAADQSRFRLCLDRARPQGPQPFRGDRMFDRCACDRRWRQADCARRRRRHGGGRDRIADLPAGDGWILRGARALDRLQRDAA